MASLETNKTKTLFGFTSPRTPEKMAPEIELLTSSLAGKKWDKDSQLAFLNLLAGSEFYESKKKQKDDTLGARDRITRGPKAFGFVDLKPVIALTPAGEALLSGNRPHEIYTRQMLKFQLPSPYHTPSKTIDFNVRPYLELIRFISELKTLSKHEIALFFLQLTHYNKFEQICDKIRAFRTNHSRYSGSFKS